MLGDPGQRGMGENITRQVYWHGDGGLVPKRAKKNPKKTVPAAIDQASVGDSSELEQDFKIKLVKHCG